MRQKCLDLWRTHIVLAALVVKQDEPTYPMDVCILGTDAVAWLGWKLLAHLAVV